MLTALLRETGTLVRQTITLAEHEMQYEMSKILKAVMWLCLACMTALAGLFTASLTFALVLYEYTGLPAWVCTSIVVILLFGGAWRFTAVGYGMAQSVRMVPVRTLRVAQDNIQWVVEWFRTRMF